MKKNVVLFTCADGREERFSLRMLIERGAIVVNKVNGGRRCGRDGRREPALDSRSASKVLFEGYCANRVLVRAGRAGFARFRR